VVPVLTNGSLAERGDSIAEGISEARVTKKSKTASRSSLSDPDHGPNDRLPTLREEGVFLGLQAHQHCPCAVRFAKESGRQTIVPVFVELVPQYHSTLFNRDLLASNHLYPDLPWHRFSHSNLLTPSRCEVQGYQNKRSTLASMDDPRAVRPVTTLKKAAKSYHVGRKATTSRLRLLVTPSARE